MYYLLPSSLKQSKLKLKVESKNGQSLGFHEFQDTREKLLKCALVDKSLSLLPVWRRFKNPFWEALEFWVLPPLVQKRIENFSLVLSPLYGFLSISDLIPFYQLRWEDVCNGQRVKDIWKPILKEKSQQIFKDEILFDFLGKERQILDFSTAQKVIKFEFYKKDQKVNTNAKHRAYVLRYIVEKNIDISQLDKINFYDYKVESIEEKSNTLTVIMKSEGRYI